jgi:hypothetical protein
MLTIREVTLGEKAIKMEREYKINRFGEEAMAIEDQKAGMVKGRTGKSAGDWLTAGTFYVHGMVYMMVRIAVNVTMTMQPYYLQNSLKFKAHGTSPTPIQLAAVPLGAYVASMIFSVYF